jgi:hypothetical protein
VIRKITITINYTKDKLHCFCFFLMIKVLNDLHVRNLPKLLLYA